MAAHIKTPAIWVSIRGASGFSEAQRLQQLEHARHGCSAGWRTASKSLPLSQMNWDARGMSGEPLTLVSGPFTWHNGLAEAGELNGTKSWTRSSIGSRIAACTCAILQAKPDSFWPPFSITAVRRTAHAEQLTTESPLQD